MSAAPTTFRSATTAATATAAAPASEFDPQSPEFTDADFEDLSDLLFIAKCAERRLENIFADEENRALNHLPRFNEGVQALWRLVSIRKALIRLNRESKIPQPLDPAPSTAPSKAAPDPFRAQASASPEFPLSSSSSSASSAPSAVESSSHSSHSSHSSPSSHSSHSSHPVEAVHQVHAVPPALSVNAVPNIPEARIADIKKINATLDKLQAALDRRVALCERTGIPVDPLTPAFPLGLTHLPFPPYEPKPKPYETNHSSSPQPPQAEEPSRCVSPSDS